MNIYLWILHVVCGVLAFFYAADARQSFLGAPFAIFSAIALIGLIAVHLREKSVAQQDKASSQPAQH